MAAYDITKWLRTQHTWLQEMAIRLRIDRELGEKDVVDFLKIIKEELTVIPDYSKFTTTITAGDELHLLSLSSIEGIDKLNPRNPLDFGKGNLTIVYGSNGSGKSGYVRILKKASGKTDKQLMHDVYKNDSTKQSCTIAYSINDVITKKTWDAGAEIPELRAMDIFDGKRGDDYLHGGQEATYIPSELAMLGDMVQLCERVNKELNNEKEKLVSKLPRLPEKYKSTRAGKYYLNLSHSSTPDFALFSENDQKRLAELQERLATSDASMKAKKLKENRREIDSIIDLIKNASEITKKENLERFRELCDEVNRKAKIANEGAAALNDVTLLDGIGTDSWKALWEAARDYSNSLAYNKALFPNVSEESLCVLCQQELDDDAKKRLTRFETHVQGKLEANARSAAIALERAIQEIPPILDESTVRTKFQAAGLDDELKNETCDMLNIVHDLIRKLRSKKPPETQAFVPPDFKNHMIKLKEIARKVEGKAIQFEKDATAFDREKVQAEVLELEARQWISEQINAISIEINRLKDLQKYEVWMKCANTRAITKEVGIASEALMTEAYVSRFNAELKKLCASKITVELAKSGNSKGKAKYHIQLKSATASSTHLTDVLSDGEKRIVSLAAFLADVSGKPGNRPFIFDDPISSLDQDFEEQTISRLMELAKERQVIIFTHRLSFLSILTDKVKRENDAARAVGTDIPLYLNTICISREPWGTGEPNNTPINAVKPLKALNRIKGEYIISARKILKEKGTAEYNIHAQTICSDFRKIIERIVEIDLMADVVQRHRRAINTRGKIHKLALISKDDCDLIDEMMTKYSAYEHSQSNEAPSILPTPDELDEDVRRMIEWLNEFSAREQRKTPMK